MDALTSFLIPLLIGVGILTYYWSVISLQQVSDAKAFYYTHLREPVMCASEDPFDTDVFARADEKRELLVAHGNKYGVEVHAYLYRANVMGKSTIGEDFPIWKEMVERDFQTKKREWHEAKIKLAEAAKQSPESADRIIFTTK